MTPVPPKNLAHSVRNRLLKLTRARGEDFNFVLVRYALERLLYRLSKSAHGGEFILKGAMLFTVSKGSVRRPWRATPNEHARQWHGGAPSEGLPRGLRSPLLGATAERYAPGEQDRPAHAALQSRPWPSAPLAWCGKSRGPWT